MIPVLLRGAIPFLRKAPGVLIRAGLPCTAYQSIKLYSSITKPDPNTNGSAKEKISPQKTAKRTETAKIDVLGEIELGTKKQLEESEHNSSGNSLDAKKEERNIKKEDQGKKVKKKRRLFKLKLSDFKLKPEPVGNIVGTVNDAVKTAPIDYYKGSYHWDYERIVAVSMVPLMMAPFVIGIEHPYIDATFSTLLLIHCRYGFQSCILDYIPERRFGIWHKVAMWTLDIGSWLALYGVYVIETEANGLFTLVCHMWGA